MINKIFFIILVFFALIGMFTTYNVLRIKFIKNTMFYADKIEFGKEEIIVNDKILINLKEDIYFAIISNLQISKSFDNKLEISVIRLLLKRDRDNIIINNTEYVSKIVNMIKKLKKDEYNNMMSMSFKNNPKIAEYLEEALKDYEV